MKNEFDAFEAAIVMLMEESGKKFPYGRIPGSTGEPGGQYFLNVGIDQVTWDSYAWNPPQYMRPGAVYEWSSWINVEEADSEPAEDPGFERIYRLSSTRPEIPASHLQTSFYGIGNGGRREWPHYPDGWSLDWPGEKCWTAKRALRRVSEEDGITAADASAMSKPSWAELMQAVMTVSIINDYNELEQRGRYDRDRRDKIKRSVTDRALIAHSLGETHVGDGLDHMTGILQAVEQATQGGRTIGPIVLRDADSMPKTLWLQSQARDLLDEVARRENVAESAHNRIIKPILDKWAAAVDENADWPDRLDRMNEHADLMDAYEENLKAEMAKYDPDALPPDLPTLKSVYVERLEGAAMARIRHFRGVLTQQGLDLPAACDDEASASRHVAAALRTASISVHGSDSTADAKSAYEAGLAAIGAIVPLNTPEFVVDGTPRGRSPAPVEISRSTVTVFADHPAGTALDALQFGFKVFDGKQRVRPAFDRYTPLEGETRRGVTMRPGPELAGRTIRIDFSARNLCGPSEMTVNLAVPGT